MLTRTPRSHKLIELELSQIAPARYQPRRCFDEDGLEELADSIRKNGLLQPVTVRALGRGRYELVAGERRLRAAGLAGMKRIPALVMELPEQRAAVLALVENLQRRDLDCFEEAEGLARLMTEQGLTQEETAALVGKTQSTIANKLRLLRLAPEIRAAVREGGLGERHARALLRLPEEQRAAAVARMAASRMTVAAAERLVERLLTDTPSAGAGGHGRRKAVVKDVRLFLNTVERAVTVMKEAGIAALSEMEEGEGWYEVRVRIPKGRPGPLQGSPPAGGEIPLRQTK
ncbi:MAG: ParB/RepB/Spo0J family partition protein [Clostridia bacterium]|nr:ParB/RepB/Spo0J family partition protein [Clostridia bacterium]